VWAIEEDWDQPIFRATRSEMEWPPRSGQRQSFPEIDRASWFGIAEARLKMLKGQAAFLDRPLEILGRAEGS
jgi:predicted NUDIX family NTP pyrophosphohydrolase